MSGVLARTTATIATGWLISGLAVGASGPVLTGRLIDVSGAGIADGRVMLFSQESAYTQAIRQLSGEAPPEPLTGAVSARDGSFRLQAPEPGFFRLRAEAGGLVPVELHVAPVVWDEDLPVAVMAADRSLEVRVVDGRGRPVAGAATWAAAVPAGFRIPVRHRPGSAGGAWRTWSAPAERRIADDAGRARLPCQGDERVAVHAWAPGFLPGSWEGRPRATVEVVLTPAPVARRLVVRDDAGRPLPGVAAFLADGRFAVGRSDESGGMKLSMRREETLDLFLEAADGRHGRARLASREATDRPDVVDLSPLSPLDGRVVDLLGAAPIAGALVWLDEDPTRFVRSDRTGSFRLLAVAEEGAEVAVAAPGYYQGDLGTAVELGGFARPAVVALRPAGAVSGVVVDPAGRPISGVEVDAMPRRDYRTRDFTALLPTSARSGDGGRFRLRPLRPGTVYDLSFERQGYAPGREEVSGIEPYRERRDLRITLLPGRRGVGRVVDDRDRPIAGAEVELVPGERQGRRASMSFFFLAGAAKRERAVRTDEAGRFAIADLSAGSFDLSASAAGFAQTRVPGIEVPAGDGEVDLGTVVLAPGVEVAGLVVDPDGAPIGGAELYVELDGRGLGRLFGPRGEVAAVSGSDGAFVIADRSAGERFDLLAVAAGWTKGGASGVVPPTGEPVLIELSPASSVHGRVLDEQGRSVAEADVDLISRAGGRVAMGRWNDTTDDLGAFSISDVPPGEVELQISAIGFRATSVSGIEVPAGGDAEPVEVRLAPGAVVTGRVVDGTGTPVIAARLELLVDDPRSSRASSRRPVVSDGDGWFRMDSMAPGAQSVEVTHDDHPRTVKDVVVEPGENRLDIVMAGGFEVPGRVVDAQGAPVSGATLWLGIADRDWGGRTTISRADGGFTFLGVEEGRYRLGADKEGFAAPPSVEVSVGTQPVAEVEVVLTPGMSLSGQLHGLELAELARVEVWASLSGGGRWASGSADHSGRYRIDNLSAGIWEVTASLADSGRRARDRVELVAGSGGATLDLEFAGGAVLAGQVLRNGEPLDGAVVSAAGQDVSSYGRATTDFSGRFSIEGLEEGRYRVEVSDYRSGLNHEEEVELGESRELQIELVTVRVEGHVLARRGRGPLADAFVELSPTNDDPTGRRSGARWETASDGGGRFLLTEVVPGRYRLSARLQGHTLAELPLEVEGFDLGGLELLLEDTEGLRFTVRPDHGAPFESVRVAALDLAGRTVLATWLQPGEGGRTRLDTLPDGRYRVLVGATGFAVASFEVDSPGDGPEVVLPSEAQLTVRVPAVAEEAAVGTVELIGADGQPFRAIGWGGTQAEWRLSRGRARVEQLPTGAWTVVVAMPDGRRWSGQVATESGLAAELVLE